ncbi:uncharacterized protein arhgef49 [Salarias fasciatus]|uniref:uncharacterized protein arhgef49 n=1 Tax=Salarias fasciatus TaxID=181472 RepID=UPI00117691B0|nr:uncharacterized protein LOC115403263 [Salarias fasciatus]
MPDVKPRPPCDDPSGCSSAAAGSPAGHASLRLRPPAPPYCPAYPGAALPLTARCSSSTLLTTLGLRYCSGRQGPEGGGAGGGAGARLPRPPGKRRPTVQESLDSELILRYACSTHWYDGPPDGGHGLLPNPESLAFYPRHGPPRKDLPLLPQLLFPAAVDEWDARRGLREKLRLQSARSAVEPLKPLPLRPQVTPGSGPRITSHHDLKQEVLRRLQLRRQNSSPNLAAENPPGPPRPLPSSYTTDSIASPRGGAGAGLGAAPARRRPPVGRLHIPTFEEFKKMRQREGPQGEGPQGEGPQGEGSDEGLQTLASDKLSSNNSTVSPSSSCASGTGTDSPIRTGPSPRSPLQPQAGGGGAGGGAGGGRRRRGSLEPPGSAPFPPCRQNPDRSSCCPALLLDGTDLSSYGAKIYRMRDGLIGSALDLIKKSCSAEISEAPVRLSRDRHSGCDVTSPSPDCHPSAVAMATSATACGAEAGDEEPAGGRGGRGGRGGEDAGECLAGPACRRSSLDAALEPADSLRAQREVRLRPHYSDPMPADASKRKQLEMKIAAAARIHSHRRERDRDRDRVRDRDSAPAALRGRSEPPSEERPGEERPGASRSGRHRWSTISSLSADSGVVGLSDEREEEDGEPRRHRRGRGAEVERADSGIGPGLSRSWKRPSAWDAHRPGPDCGCRERGERMCERCCKLRTERKEAILEFLNTESSYGEDLRIIREEFYCPMQSAALLTAEQLAVVFANVQELIDVNERFTEHLQDGVDQAFDQGDEDLLTVYIGEIFLEFVSMLPAFQTYCLQQSSSVNMLNALEKEKELLRIFLDVSQNDNTALRRMNLRSFLMAPLQRVTKYPLLLSRIIKVTPESHPDHGRLREAKSRVESHLEHINMKTRQEGNGVAWSLRSFRRDSRKNREVINIEMREVSMKTVGWARENTRFVMEGPLQLSQPADGQWLKKGSKALKFQNVQSLLMVRTRRAGEAAGQGGEPGAQGEGEGGPESVRDGVLVLIKDKSSGKLAVLREPIRLGNCVVSADPDADDTFEVLDIRREAFVFRASDKSRTQQWFHQIKRYARDLGTWRRRRNALPNIMINTNQTRS